MQHCRHILTFLSLLAFACQMFYGHGVGSYNLSSAASLSFCANTELPKTSKFEFSNCQAVEISCNTNISLFFLPIYYSLQLLEGSQNNMPILYYKNIQEQLYITKLLEPPKTIGYILNPS